MKITIDQLKDVGVLHEVINLNYASMELNEVLLKKVNLSLIGKLCVVIILLDTVTYFKNISCSHIASRKQIQTHKLYYPHIATRKQDRTYKP